MGDVSVASRCTSRARRSAASACATLAFARSRCADAERRVVSAASRRCFAMAPVSNSFCARSCSMMALASAASDDSTPACATLTAATAASTCASISRRSMVAIAWPACTRSPISTATCDRVPGSLAKIATRVRGARLPEICSVDSRSAAPTVSAGTSTRCSATGAAAAAVGSASRQAERVSATPLTRIRVTSERETRLRMCGCPRQSRGLARDERAIRGDKRGADGGGETGEQRFEDVARERIWVFARCEPLREADGCRAEHAGPEHVQGGGGVERARELAALDAGADVGLGAGGGLLEELEALEVLVQARHRAVEEHQPEVFGVRFRELVERPQAPAQPLERIVHVPHRTKHTVAEDAEALLGEGEEDVVLALEVAVDRGRAVVDAVGNLAHRDVLVPLLDEEVAGGIENGLLDALPVAFLA